MGDRIRGAGSLGGLYTALVEAPTEQVLVMACDMPFLTAPFLERLAAPGAGADAAIPRDRREGRLRLLDALEGLHVREMDPEDVASFDRNGRLLLNVNSPEDYARATA